MSAEPQGADAVPERGGALVQVSDVEKYYRRGSETVHVLDGIHLEVRRA